jgi:hypothetical protein
MFIEVSDGATATIFKVTLETLFFASVVSLWTPLQVYI